MFFFVFCFFTPRLTEVCTECRLLTWIVNEHTGHLDTTSSYGSHYLCQARFIGPHLSEHTQTDTTVSTRHKCILS